MKKYLTQTSEFSIWSHAQLCFVDFHAQATKNAISLQIVENLKEVISFHPQTQKTLFEDFLIENNVEIIVVRSLVNGIFCSGANLADLALENHPMHSSYAHSIRGFCSLLNSLPVPSVAFLNGNAYGGGVEIALATDFRWNLGEQASFHFVQTKLGVPGGWGGMARLGELCPFLNPKKVSALFLKQEVWSLEDLRRLMLIDQNFASEDEALCALDVWRDTLLSCARDLKQGLMQRQFVLKEELKEFDAHLFNQFFLCDEHKKYIHKFLSQKKNKK